MLGPLTTKETILKTMAFSLVEQEARDFVARDPACRLQVLKADKRQGRIYLSSVLCPYELYVTCPSKELTEWSVWSDDSNSMEAIACIMDHLKPDSSSIASVLATISKCLKSESCQKIFRGTAGKDRRTNKAEENSDQGHSEDDDDDDDDADDDDDLDDYYNDDDFDAEVSGVATKTISEKQEEANLQATFFCGDGSSVAVHRLIKDLKGLNKTSASLGITASPRGSNLFIWDVKITDVPKNTRLGKDLDAFAKKYKEDAAIKMDMQFPPDYPFSPPFIRVIKPRFKFLTGHVTIGGSICMQMLTKSGWRPTNDIESILVQVRCEILSDPNASLDSTRPNSSYSEDEAKKAFHRMVAKYGW